MTLIASLPEIVKKETNKKWLAQHNGTEFSGYKHGSRRAILQQVFPQRH